jgi:DNA-binding MarR family transcriptional regulator
VIADNGKTSRDKTGDSEIVLGILEVIDSGEPVTQRAVANELGVALGLVNAYLKRCMTKGLIKVTEAPARRYAYYLTPKGFAEKAKLTASYLSHSFSFFRAARADCDAVLEEAVRRQMRSLALVGASDLAEIMRVCAGDRKVHLVAVVDPKKTGHWTGLPIVASFDQLKDVDGVIVTDLVDPQRTFQLAVAAFGADRVHIPAMLRRRWPRAAASQAGLRRKAS